MSYAVRKDGKGWRAVDSAADCTPFESFSTEMPALPVLRPEVQTVTMRQARLALLAIGKLRAVEDTISGLPEPDRTKAQIEWDYAATVEKNSPLIRNLAPLIGIDQESLTELFNTAATL